MAPTLTVGPQIREVLLRFTTTTLPQDLARLAQPPRIAKHHRGMVLFEMTAENYGLAHLLDDFRDLGFELHKVEIFHRTASQSDLSKGSRYAIHLLLGKGPPPNKTATEFGRSLFDSLAKEKWRLMAHINPTVEGKQLTQGKNLSVNFSYRAQVGSRNVEHVRAEPAA